MLIQNETLFQWLVAAIGGVLTFLGSLAVRNNRDRFLSVDKQAKDLTERVEKLESRINDKLPEAMQDLKAEIKGLDGRISTVETKVEFFSGSFISRMDKLEQAIPGQIEAALFRLVATGQLSANTQRVLEHNHDI